MLSLKDLVETLNVERTVLFLGAGASVPSGAPSGVQLARHLQNTLANGENISDDLMELSGILERRYGRASLVQAVRAKLNNLQPTGGITALPDHSWATIYTTNFDRIIEVAFKRCGKPLTVIRSNFDYHRSNEQTGTILAKLHGCVTQDVVDGHNSRLVLSEYDYDEYASYRESLFKKLDLDLSTKDVLIIGYSLRDPHLRRDIKEAARLQKSKGASGRVFVLAYDRDEDRAGLLENQGLRVAFGGIDDFMDALATRSKANPPVLLVTPDNTLLPTTLRASTIDAAQLQQREPNIAALFNGSPASYADIAHGYTFERSLEAVAREHLKSGKEAVTIIGVGGVGKTTMARRLAIGMQREGVMVWEHNNHFPLRANDWIAVAAELSATSKRGLLVIDDSPKYQAEVNNLLDGIVPLNPSSFQLILTGEKSAWLPRKKTPRTFSRGVVITLYLLEVADIQRMVSLLADKPEIRRLVDTGFASLSNRTQIERLRQRCSADMYVSLKHVFGSEKLDTIILQEYAALRDDLRDVYRTVAALEAAGTRIHRQLIIRLLGIQADQIASILSLLEGIVDEYDVSAKDGLYGWRTRHEVIAQALSRFKFSEQEEFIRLINEVVDELNPMVHLEHETIIHLCNAEMGIRKIVNKAARIAIYRKLVNKVPGQRVPRHRLIRELIEGGMLDEADNEIRLAIDTVGNDSPLQRYKARIYLERAKQTQGLLRQDQRVLIEDAHRVAQEALQRFPDDKYTYAIFEDIGWTLKEICDDGSLLDEALEQLRIGYERTLDPELEEKLRRLRHRMRR